MSAGYPLLSSTFHRWFGPRARASVMWNYLGFAGASCAVVALGPGVGAPEGSLVSIGWAVLASALAAFAWRRSWRMIDDDQPA